MHTRKSIMIFALIATLRLVSAFVQAGPEDQFTKYKVGVGIGDVSVSGIADTGGTTTISFADAKRMGILDANGDPGDFDADGTQRMGGTGGGSVTCHIFKDVWIEVQPKKADGTNNGPKRTVKVTIFVPKKPSEQTGANDAAKRRKTNSVPTKVGANICGATIDGHKLDFTDKATNDPKKNKRSTSWRAVGAGGGGGGSGGSGGGNGTDGADKRAPAHEDDNFEDEEIHETYLPEVWVNGQPCSAMLNTAPVTCFGVAAAQQFGVFPIGQEVLDFENHQILFMAGLIDLVPDSAQEIVLPIGECLVEIPTLEGEVVAIAPVLAFILPEGDPWTICVGGNGLVPPGTSGWLDNETDLYHWDFDVACFADFNGDGAINTLDVLAFLNAWNQGVPEADVNGDGEINTLDVLAFLNAWNTGCG